MKFSLENAGEMAEAVGYVSLPAENYEEGLNNIRRFKIIR